MPLIVQRCCGNGWQGFDSGTGLFIGRTASPEAGLDAWATYQGWVEGRVNSEPRTLTGRIIVVQEQRFRLVTDEGRGMVFTLGTFANATMGDLARYKASNAPVTVHYTGEPSFASGVAQRVEPARMENHEQRTL